MWDELFPAEPVRLLQLMIERIDIAPDGAERRLRGVRPGTMIAEVWEVEPAETVRTETETRMAS